MLTENLRPSIYSSVEKTKSPFEAQPEVIDLDKRPPVRSTTSINNPQRSVDVQKKTSGGGLQWMSLNDDNSSCSPAVSPRMRTIQNNVLNIQQQHSQNLTNPIYSIAPISSSTGFKQQQRQQQQQPEPNLNNPLYNRGIVSSRGVEQQQQQ